VSESDHSTLKEVFRSYKGCLALVDMQSQSVTVVRVVLVEDVLVRIDIACIHL
jgi:hypothetical protein